MGGCGKSCAKAQSSEHLYRCTPSSQRTIPSHDVTKKKDFSSSSATVSRYRSKWFRWSRYIGFISTRISSLLVRLSFQFQPNPSIIYAEDSLPVPVDWLLPSINMVVNFKSTIRDKRITYKAWWSEMEQGKRRASYQMVFSSTTGVWSCSLWKTVIVQFSE